MRPIMRTVLVADDSSVARHALVRRLAAHDLNVHEEASARGAASVDATECACAVLDLDLGDGDGVGVAEALRKDAPALRVAFFSSDTDGGLVERAKAIGPVFKKPDDLEALVAWVLE
jgi:DNA-binding NarL/FixJ family response regulator